MNIYAPRVLLGAYISKIVCVGLPIPNGNVASEQIVVLVNPFSVYVLPIAFFIFSSADVPPVI